MGDFNMTTSNPVLSQFLDTFALSPLNIDPASIDRSSVIFNSVGFIESF